MTYQNPSSNTKVCPTCGTRVNENATRCLVCGRALTPTAAPASAKSIQGPRMPEITLSLPVALGLLVLILAIGAAVVFTVLRSTGQVVQPTVTPTITSTATITITPSPTPTETLAPPPTSLPPVDYTVKSGDTCGLIASIFNVTPNSIVLLNNLSADCTLFENQKLKVPQPTPTASPQPTSTLSQAEATEQACEKVDYTVNANDTLGGIAAAYKVSGDAIKAFNKLPSDTVFAGQTLKIPLCQRQTTNATPTPTAPPPYPAANLLLPADGASFTVANETITLQWASVGELRQNETYAITLEDVTAGEARKLVEYVTDTKYIVPATFRPEGNTPHVLRWSIVPVRQTGTTKDGQAIYEPAGAASVQRVFSWWGATVATPTP